MKTEIIGWMHLAQVPITAFALAMLSTKSSRSISRSLRQMEKAGLVIRAGKVSNELVWKLVQPRSV